MKLQTIRNYLHQNSIAGWLLYDFRGQNPIAASVAGLESTGTRRWFLWIPANGEPQWLVHAIEQTTFSAVDPEMTGPLHLYVGWQEMEQKLRAILPQDASSQIAMEYSPRGAIPYVSKVDAGTLEMVRANTRASVVSSADLVQLVQAVLTSQQMETHRRAAAHMLAAKDAAFAFVAQALRQQQEITEYGVQQLIVEQFRAANLTWDHDPIVAVNGNAALPHYAPNAQQHSPIRRGDVLLIDLWAKEKNNPDDCYADITWTAYCGAEPPPTASRVFAVVAQARNTAITVISQAFEAGKTLHGYQVDDAVSSRHRRRRFRRRNPPPHRSQPGTDNPLERCQHRQRRDPGPAQPDPRRHVHNRTGHLPAPHRLRQQRANERAGHPQRSQLYRSRRPPGSDDPTLPNRTVKFGRLNIPARFPAHRPATDNK